MPRETLEELIAACGELQGDIATLRSGSNPRTKAYLTIAIRDLHNVISDLTNGFAEVPVPRKED